MTPLPKKYFEIYTYARFLGSNKKIVSATELAMYLNRNGIRTDYGREYDAKGRGIYRAISAAYERVNACLGEAEAAYIAEALLTR